MASRIPASEWTSQKLNELLTEGVADGDARAELPKLAVGKIVEEALEVEVAEVVGRGYYEAGAAPGAGYRNGYRRGRMRTAEGTIEYGVPQVADRPELFVPRVRAGRRGGLPGCHRRQPAEPHSVSQVTERLWQEYEAVAARDLSEFAVVYFFVDGAVFRR